MLHYISQTFGLIQTEYGGKDRAWCELYIAAFFVLIPIVLGLLCILFPSLTVEPYIKVFYG